MASGKSQPMQKRTLSSGNIGGNLITTTAIVSSEVECEEEPVYENMPKPLKVVDITRESRVGLTASSLTELIFKAKQKFNMEDDQNIKIVLECDGTEIDDNDYFLTMEPDTSLMILASHEKWTPYKPSISTCGVSMASSSEGEADGLLAEFAQGVVISPVEVEELVWRLHQDLSFFPWLTTSELNAISKMNIEEMRNVFPDIKFLEFLQDLSERYLQNRDRSRSGSDNGSIISSSFSLNGIDGLATNAIIHDPRKLIKMYSKGHPKGTSNGFIDAQSKIYRAN